MLICKIVFILVFLAVFNVKCSDLKDNIPYQYHISCFFFLSLSHFTHKFVDLSCGFFSYSISLCHSVSPCPLFFLTQFETKLRIDGDMTAQSVPQPPVLPLAILTVLSRMNEHSVLTQGAALSNNKTLLCSVKFYEMLNLVSRLGPQKAFSLMNLQHVLKVSVHFHLQYLNFYNEIRIQ